MRWIKLLRDVRAERGRTAIMLAAITFALLAVAAMLSAYGIVTREAQVNYLATNPASATIDVDEVTPRMIDLARAFPGVVEAEPRAVVEARVKVGAEWMRMLLFVVDDFATLRLNRFKPVSGAWPPADGTMLIERQAAGVIGTAEGGSVTIKTARGQVMEIPVTGTVHDTTLAPAWQEQSGYGYLTRRTLAKLGADLAFDELRILVGGTPAMAEIDAVALALADRLKAQGFAVHGVKVPPPGQHPHQGQIRSGLLMFLSLAVAALVLAAILVAAVLAASLARQAREIGVMKAVGARGGQIAGMYLALLLALGAVSVTIALPAGILLGGRLSDMMAETMNFVVTDRAVPPWVMAVIVAAGLLMPLIAALPVVIRAARLTVRETLATTGVASDFGASGFDRAVAVFRGSSPTYLLALRNTFRRRGRLALALAMLAAGGGLFVTALSVRDGWRTLAASVLTDRRYDVEFRFATPVSREAVAQALAPVAGIAAYEVWGYEQTAYASAGRVDLKRTYPDRGHGGFALLGVPPSTGMVGFPMMEGRWLTDGDTDAVVLTQQNHGGAARPKIGDRISLSIGGHPAAWTVVGIMREIGGGGAYVPKPRYDALAGTAGAGQIVRVAFGPGHRPEAVTAGIEAALAGAGLPVERAAPLTMLYLALVGHVEVPVRMLVAAAALLGLIGGLGLASMMVVGVLERTREFGVMKAIGARPATVVRIVLGESATVAALSWVAALVVALPLIAMIGSFATTMFGTRLPFVVSWVAASLWLAVVIVIALAAAAVPAVRAARLVIRDALAHA